MFQQFAQTSFCAMQLGLDGAKRYTERIGQFLVLPTAQVVRRDEKPCVVGKLRKRLVQPIAELQISVTAIEYALIQPGPAICTEFVERYLHRTASALVSAKTKRTNGSAAARLTARCETRR